LPNPNGVSATASSALRLSKPSWVVSLTLPATAINGAIEAATIAKVRDRYRIALRIGLFDERCGDTARAFQKD
jgi:predicted DNA-binding protein (UPF0278 family)